MKPASASRAVLDRTIERYPSLESCKIDLEEAIRLIISAYESNHKLLTVGNGGSSADADHIVGELMKSFELPRPLPEALSGKLRDAEIDAALKERLSRGLEQPLPAINLTSHTALSSAFSNDADPGLVYAQSLLGFGTPGDVLVALSTSGNSDNIVAAAALAGVLEISVVSLTGRNGGRLRALADVAVRAPAERTAEVQEYHLPIYHCLCSAVEAYFFG